MTDDRKICTDTPSPHQQVTGDTITLTPAEAWSLLHNDPKDLRAQVITRMAVWLDGLRFTPVATSASENSHD